MPEMSDLCYLQKPQIALWINVSAADWTVERVTIASNLKPKNCEKFCMPG